MEDRPTLEQLNKKETEGFYLSDKGTIHSYLPSYDQLFTPYRDLDINIFEVGYQHGGSSVLWERYFSKAIIKSIDVDIHVPLPQSERIILDIANVMNLTSEYFSDFIPDIVIDDGSHFLEEQVHLIKIAYPVIRKGGIIIVEDIHCIDTQNTVFESIGIPYEIFDLRGVKNRFDDVFLLFRK